MEIQSDHTSSSIDSLVSYGMDASQQERAAVAIVAKGGFDRTTVVNQQANVETIQLQHKSVEDTLIDTSNFTFFPPVIDEDSALSLWYNTNPTYDDNYSSTLGINDDKNFYIHENSHALHDGHIRVETSNLDRHFSNGLVVKNNEPEPDQNLYNIKAEFDYSEVNAYKVVAVNSEYNTKLNPSSPSDVGVSPLLMVEDNIFNTTKAGGLVGFNETKTQYTSKWASLDNRDSRDPSTILKFTDIDSQYQPSTNNLIVTERDLGEEELTRDMAGVYKIVTETPSVVVSLKSGSTTLSDYENFPVGYHSAVATIASETTNVDTKIPDALTVEQFNSLFSQEVLDTIKHDYNIEVFVQSSGTAGYSITDTTILKQLNDSDLKDSALYMKEYVNLAHSVSVTPGAVDVSAKTDAIPTINEHTSIDVTQGETLMSNFAGIDGEFTIDSKTRRNRVEYIDQPDESILEVNYKDDLNIGTRNYISSELENSKNVQVLLQKVAQQQSTASQTNASEVLKTSGDATLSYNLLNGPINDQIAANTVTFINNTTGDNNIRIFEITSQNRLVSNTDSVYTQWDVTEQLPVEESKHGKVLVDALMQNLKSDVLLPEKIRFVSEMKGLNNFAFTNNLPSNWSLQYSNTGDSFVKVSTALAFGDQDNVPRYSPSIMTNEYPLNIEYSFRSKTSGSLTGSLLDSVLVRYSNNLDYSNATEFVIPQSQITRTFISSVPDTITVVSDDNWNFKTGSFKTQETYELVYVVRSNTYSASFDAKIGGYSNLKFKVDNIVETRTYYALRNKQNGQFMPSSSLQDVVSSSITNLTIINETISASGDDDASLTFGGRLELTDLKPALGRIEGYIESSWTTVSDIKDIDMVYGSKNTFELTNLDDETLTGPDVVITFEVSQIDIDDATLENYMLYVPFYASPENDNYSLNVFETSPSGLALVLGSSTDVLSVSDNYSVLQPSETNQSKWLENHSYKIEVDSLPVVETNAGIQGGKVIKIVNDGFVFTEIREQNTRPFLGKRYITRITNDVWRSVLTLDISEPVEQFFYGDNTVYKSFSVEENRVLVVPSISGVHLSRASYNMDSVTYLRGYTIQGRIMSDIVKVNMVGLVTEAEASVEGELGVINNQSLMFQRTTDTTFTAKLTFAKYRGYQQVAGNLTTAPKQYYSINRSSSELNFNIGALTQRLSNNMYQGEVNVVDNLTGNGHVINLGIKTESKFSIPPVSAATTISVDVKGDNVSVIIRNLNQESTSSVAVDSNVSPVSNQNSYTINSTLKQYGRDAVFTFSGLNFNDTSRSLQLRPNRIKLRTLTFDHNSASYMIRYTEGNSILHKALPLGINSAELQLDLGNPVSYANSWSPLKTLGPKTINSSTDNIENGFNVGKLNLRQDPSKLRLPSTTYFTIQDALMLFEIMAYVNNDNTLSLNVPYQLEDSNEFVVKRRLVSNDTGVYKPFDKITIKDINANDQSLEFNASTRDSINDVTFTYVKQPSYHDLLTKTINNLSQYVDDRRVNIPGTSMRITRYVGNYSSSADETVLFDGPITSLTTVSDISLTSIYLRSRGADNTYYIDIAQDPAVNGFVDSVTDGSKYEQIWQTTDNTKYYNIELVLANPSWFNDVSERVVYFDIHSNGVNYNLYSAISVFDRTLKVSKIRVFKYEGIGNLDTNDYPLHETRTLSFNTTRSYLDLDLPSFGFTADPESKGNFDSLLKNIEMPTELNWVVDTEYDNTLIMNVAYGNENTSAKLGAYFTVPNDARKILAFKHKDFLSVKNQFGIKTFSVNWLGVAKVLQLSTNSVTLSPAITQEQATLSSSNNSAGILSSGSVTDPVTLPSST